ncbi:hypothetical protein MAC_07159 [Metarhizium acridum CQMa 102]|uniref:Uncharacterized protein n=2 Tax=Metarhizium acridum TaxID=92637 RepID=E9EBB1_METAQ|nr:uncharacterized protein MAC_07159 [Metarhizium acridum CQMa 102]EFY86755.1 hypothetical protein MAC_07159 [Metarhizium acridum CQMa 102]
MWPGSNSTYRLQNVRNGTSFNMDVHIGNPPFMSSDTRHEELPEAAALADDERVRHQRRRVLDHLHRHSRINRHEDPPLDSPTAAPSISSSSGLSSSAAAGIGVGVALGVIILAAAGFLGWRLADEALPE